MGGGVGGEKMKRGEGKRKEGWGEHGGERERGKLYWSQITKLSQNNLSARSLGHCGNIILDWGFKSAEKARHWHLWVYC